MKNTLSKTPRSSNFELMRIVLILMILAIHYFGSGGGFLGGIKGNLSNLYLAACVISCFSVSVDVFVLLTGYFSCNKDKVRISKPILLYTLTVFYGLVIAISLILIERPAINWVMIQRFFPTVFYQWFVMYYCLLWLMIPFLNKIIHCLSKDQFKQMLLIMLILWCGIDTFFPRTIMYDRGYGIANFIMLYFIGAYLRLYKKPLKRCEGIMLYVVCAALICAFSYCTYSVWNYNNILVVFGAIGFFEFFRSLKMNYHPLINWLATYTFVVYIIHNNLFMLRVFYLKWFHAPWFWYDKFVLCNMITCVVGIWVFCIIVETLRRKLLGKIMDKKIESISKEIG